MTLTNDTVYKGYLTHVRAMARQAAKLYFEKANHPDNETHDVQLSPTALAIREEWDILRRDTEKVLGVVMLPWERLASREELIVAAIGTGPGKGYGGDPLRITMGVLKDKADKARLKDPTITLLKSWDKAARIPEEVFSLNWKSRRRRHRLTCPNTKGESK